MTRNEANLREVSSIHKDTPPPVLTHEKGDDEGELGQLESELEKTACAVEAAEPRYLMLIIDMKSIILMMLCL